MNNCYFDSSIKISIDVKDDILFGTQNDVFRLFDSKKKPYFKGCYEIVGTSYAIWFPQIPIKAKKWRNTLNGSQSEIKMTSISNMKNKTKKISEFKIITFAKYDDGIKFIGVFVEKNKNKKITIFNKISNAIIIEHSNKDDLVKR